jgi:hypothetical protein
MRDDPDSWALWISSEACRSGQSLGSRRLRVGVEKMRPMRVAPILAVDIFVPQLYRTNRKLSKGLGGVLLFLTFPAKAISGCVVLVALTWVGLSTSCRA